MANAPRKVQQVPINEPAPLHGRIAWYVENALVRFSKRVFNAIADGLKEIISYALSEFMELVEPGILSATNPVLNEMKGLPGIPASVVESISQVQRGDNQSDGILATAYAFLGVVGFVTGTMNVTGRVAQHTVDGLYRSNRPSPDALWAMVRRGTLSPENFELYMQDEGWPDDLIRGWGTVTQTLLSGGDLGQAYLRGTINVDEFKKELSDRGYSQTSIDIASELLNVIPSPQDLIRMAVREAWHDEVARKFGYDDDFPAEFAEWSEKIGLSSDWAKRFWRAHWELPGVREGFEMLHRRIINEDELELLMRSRDIPSFWRERLTQVSYRPFNRVDVRRMYREGVLTEDDVFDSYRDLGYDDEKSGKLTQWTVAEYSQDNRDLAKGDVLSAYQAGTITQAEAFGYLSVLDYGEDEILLLLARVDLKKEEAFEKEYVQNVRVAFVGGIIEEQDVFAQLGQINPPAGFIEERLKLWRVQRQRSAKKPTLAQLRDFWLADVIPEDTLRKELSSLGYVERYIDWFLMLWKGS